MSDNAPAFYRLLDIAHARGAALGSFLDARDLTSAVLDRLAETERGAVRALTVAALGDRSAGKVVEAFDAGLAARRQTLALVDQVARR